MKILLADPHTEVRSALRLVFERSPAVTVVREASSLVQLLAQCTQVVPDLILLDLDLVHPSRSQTLADLILVLHRLSASSKVVIMSSRFGAEQEALAAGASGFISKTDPPDLVLARIVQYLENGS